ncbi:MAG: restriction endonuclease subunit S, partial [Desulfobacteraceae bacterium]|nr:restriction endonuclease subunit S [Desulfobacteraceae bacterium]
LFNNKNFRTKINNLAGGSAASMINISKAKLKELNIPVPPITLQNNFAEKVEKIEIQKQKMQKSLKDLEQNFSSLMQRAFKGEI